MWWDECLGGKNLWNWSHRSSSRTCLSKLWMLSRTCEDQMNSCIWHRFENSPVPHQFSSVQSLSHVWLFLTPWTAAHKASLSITNSQTLLKLMPIKSVMPSNHPIFCHPFLLLPSIFSSIKVFPKESDLHIRWPKYWSFSFSISPSNDIQDWFLLGLTDLISLQSKGLLGVFSNTTVQNHQFFRAQLSL